jgi:hypothetical protein
MRVAMQVGMKVGMKVGRIVAKLGAVGLLLTSACASSDARDGSPLRVRKETTADRKCASVPACQDYIQQIRRLVYENWKGSESLPPGSVLIGFKLDVNGNVSAVRTIDASDAELGRSCRSALVYASPLGLLPASLGFLANQPITLELSVPAPVASGSPARPKPER